MVNCQRGKNDAKIVVLHFLSAPKSTEASEETTKDTVVTEAPADESDVDKVVDKKSNGGVAAVVIIVLIVVAVVAFVLYKRCKSDYQGMWF